MMNETNALKEIVSPLLTWYHANHRKLPWRENKDPYRVWVSEIMLQQTRVEAVIPYYERFMRRCPDVASLAACGDEELYKLWEGLGYYSRAGNLKKAANVICERYEGQFPEQFEEILSLPGIGAYTAGAISSIAFGKLTPAVDGNVLRVITRLTEDDHDIMDAGFRKQVTEKLEKIYPERECGDLTQSLMELGAVVCVPNGLPKCEACPVRFLCGAYHSQTQLQYPVRKKKAARRIEKKTVLILTCEDKTAIRKRDNTGVLAGMWELPNVDGNLTKKQVLAWLAEKGFVVKDIRKISDGKKQFKHIFTHIEWHMTCWTAACEAVAKDSDLTWVSVSQLEAEIALPTAFKNLLKAYLKTN